MNERAPLFLGVAPLPTPPPSEYTWKLPIREHAQRSAKFEWIIMIRQSIPGWRWEASCFDLTDPSRHKLAIPTITGQVDGDADACTRNALDKLSELAELFAPFRVLKPGVSRDV